ncbi:MAG: hypothetical protein COW16_08225 [Sphingomonadales bacterium CG12_big_fil_rev_8_21_14_0_65_65_10]|nr:MAG: hypothetical protein COW16_08225 [Sphingomonadales bacterium CG12_big_fil_rev_8_21_14_0_65_65_10]
MRHVRDIGAGDDREPGAVEEGVRFDVEAVFDRGVFFAIPDADCGDIEPQSADHAFDRGVSRCRIDEPLAGECGHSALIVADRIECGLQAFEPRHRAGRIQHFPCHAGPHFPPLQAVFRDQNRFLASWRPHVES